MKRVSLARQIKQVIGTRVLICSFLLMLVILSLFAYNVFSSVAQIKGGVNEQIKPLEDFAISQVMIDNPHAVYFKLGVINSSQKEYHIQWFPYSSSSDYNHVRWSPPFSWAYDYELANIGGYQFGYFEISGSFLSDRQLIYDVCIGVAVVLFSLLTMLFLLFPLSTKIPEKLFIKPINRFLELVSNLDIKLDANKVLSKSLPIELEELETKIFALLKQAQERERNQSLARLGEVAAQVVHDIRSPLAALKTHIKALPHIPEAQRIAIRNAVNSVTDIANNLLAQHKGLPADQAVTYKIWLLAPLIESTISEKRVNLDENHIELDSQITDTGFSAFAKCDSNQIKRILSNLINNAVEAFDPAKKGHITVSLNATKFNIELAVLDNGAGMSPEQVEKILKGKGDTTKEKGNGIGLPHAKEMIESWGGDFVLGSKVGEGTKVTLNLPPAKAPDWFVSEIMVSPDILIGILDDDDSVHDAWDQRLLAVSKKLQIHHFKNSQSFIDWYQAETGPVQVFSDYELLRDPMTGLEVLEKLELGRNALLVTSHYENPDIMERCQKRGIRLLPKNLLAHVPIILKKAVAIKAAVLKKYDLVLLDDMAIATDGWEMAAMSAGKNILSFNTIEAFEEALESIDPATPIYIDSELGNGIKGEEYAEGLFKRGFKELYLATGHDAEHFGALPWLKGIVGKEPPFDL